MELTKELLDNFLTERNEAFATYSNFTCPICHKWEAWDSIGEHYHWKLWHDDVRRPPDTSWVWARTNDIAIKLIDTNGKPDECSLDHDLGLHNADPDVPDADMQQGWDEENDGFDLVKWMVDNDFVPDKVTIHSWNPWGAERMASYIRNAIEHGAISNNPTVIVKRFLREEK